jgi:hypothetical protein
MTPRCGPIPGPVAACDARSVAGADLGVIALRARRGAVSGVGERVSRLPSGTALAIGAATAQAICTAALLHPGLVPFPVWHPRLLLPLVTVPLFGLAVRGLSRVQASTGALTAVVLAFGALLQVIALSHSPTTSNDDLRYIWDAKVQTAGIDPYRYAPQDPHLDRLHEPLLFARCTDPAGCALLNRPAVHTVYPPVAQASFVAIRIASAGDKGGQFPYQLAAALGALAVTALLIGFLRRRARPVWHAAVWAWCPVTVSEFGNNAHIDWLAVLLAVGALLCYSAGRLRWAGVLIGAAIATKVYPALLLVALLRRNPRRLLAYAAGIVVLGYVPHIAAVGTKVIGYLPGYLREEGYAHGSRLQLIGLVIPTPIDTVAGALLLVALAWRCLCTSDATAPEQSATWLVGAALLIATPNYGWYAALLIALVAMTAQWHWLPVALAPTFTYLYNGEFRNQDWSRPTIYAIALISAGLLYLSLRRRSSACP